MSSKFLIYTQYTCIAVIIFLSFFQLANAELTTTLKLGQKSPQVAILQKILNQDSYTQVALGGAGSPGKESDYFGILTQKAVMKFQEKYAPEILFPAGIYNPTGIVGLFSIKKLNALDKSGSTGSEISSSTIIPETIRSIVPKAVATSSVTFSPDYLKALQFRQIVVSHSKPLMFTISKYQAKHGDVVRITGNGFLSTENTVFLGKDYSVGNIVSGSGTELSFIVPETVPNDSYTVWVENKNGSTFNPASSKFFTVTDNPKQAPTVVSISPKTIPYSDIASVTISGTNFHPENNALYSAFGVVKGLKSNGDSIQVPLSAFSGLLELSKNINRVKGQSVQVYITIQNMYGYSSKPGSFLVQF